MENARVVSTEKLGAEELDVRARELEAAHIKAAVLALNAGIYTTIFVSEWLSVENLVELHKTLNNVGELMKSMMDQNKKSHEHKEKQ